MSILVVLAVDACFITHSTPPPQAVSLRPTPVPNRDRRQQNRNRFSFYQRWFDTFFFISGCVTAVSLLAFHLANRTSDADHHDHHAPSTKKRADAEAFSSAGMRPGVGALLKDKKG